MREALSSALDARGLIRDRRVLDLFAGTGALAFEALSRGARDAVLVEKAPAVAKAIERSARELGLEARTRVIVADLLRADTKRWLEALAEPVELVLIDPPYAEIARVEFLLSTLAREGKLAPDATVVIEHARRDPPTLPIGFSEISSYRYGDTSIVLATFTPSQDTHS